MLGCFTAGLVTGSLLTGGVLWLLSGLAQPLPVLWRELTVVLLAVAGVLHEVGVLRPRLPQNARQIPREVLQRRLLRGAFQFGFELGTGVRTYLSAVAPYVVALAVLLTCGGAGPALLAGAGFGAGRALTPLARIASGDGERWDRRLAERLRWIGAGSTLSVAVLLAVHFLA